MDRWVDFKFAYKWAKLKGEKIERRNTTTVCIFHLFFYISCPFMGKICYHLPDTAVKKYMFNIFLEFESHLLIILPH